ncbi:MAG: hypothetical protein SynsKO_24480 [Synoicihabitans sp.]
MAAEQAFPPTAPNSTEIKTLPAGILLKSSAEGNYFDNGGKLFGPLFRYISQHKIAMTTPVEAKIDDAAMYFWVHPNEAEKVAGSKNGVEVIDIPERTVAVRGAKGGYNKGNFNETRDELTAWLENQSDWRATGEPYGVYWDGPFTPWFMKTYEVQIPVERVSAAPDLTQYRWQNRVLVVEVPTRDDPAYHEQLQRFEANATAMDERDLVVETVTGADGFQVSLYGLDGGRKWRQTEPLDMETLFALIDSMPMRQAEMRSQKKGQ